MTSGPAGSAAQGTQIRVVQDAAPQGPSHMPPMVMQAPEAVASGGASTQAISNATITKARGRVPIARLR